MSDAARRIHVRSVADVATLLTDPDPACRLAACASVGSAPATALRLEKRSGDDVLDVLIERLEAPLPRAERQALLDAICRFDDARVPEVLQRVLAGDVEDSILHMVARIVRDRQVAIGEDLLLTLLRDPASMTRVRIAAELLGAATGVTAEDRIRLAAFAPGRHPFPPVCPDTIDGWAAALQGMFGEYIQRMVDEHCPGLDGWAGFWKRFDSRTRIWLARRACYGHPGQPSNDAIIALALADEPRIRAIAADSLRLYR